MADIKLSNVKKRFGKVQTIHGVDLEIDHGEFVVFVGPSGCGKSTLLRLIAGLETISDGEIFIGGNMVNDVEPAERGISMVFQSYALYPHMTVEENMGFGLKMNGVSKDQVNKQVLLAAKTLQLEPLLKRRPKELSGGQRQRVAIGRAIVRNPSAFLFDEPLSNLDAELRVEMRLQIARLHQEIDTTMIYVTHDQVEAMTLADKIVVLRDGRIEQVGSPLELYNKPINMFVAGFIGSPKMNFIDGAITEVDKEFLNVRLADEQIISIPMKQQSGSKVGDLVKVGIRPEHIHVEEEKGNVTIRFTSEVVERLGNSTYLFGQYAKQEGFIVHHPGDKEVSAFDNIDLYFSVSDCHVFDESGICISN
ncbi:MULTISPECIES: sn-glycerol-3-phosphate ABC transporter ATP-binding protein UgpC [Vibrio]|uniref:ABC transporter ATP-binding protein n=1 Tax=Vibrio TaxID=662 RepID=UPI000243C0CC|nr:MULTISPECIES: sn-glycerol-3-phosphate ABC transporter ATP-binding protein UgpC [Vibrio]AEX22332.1 ABC transporter ATP-binding protein [Vibrio sp. EJY3]BDR13335.1 ABC transporter ATP-binding protein [Vibrio sp. STUT-A11]